MNNPPSPEKPDPFPLVCKTFFLYRRLGMTPFATEFSCALPFEIIYILMHPGLSQATAREGLPNFLSGCSHEESYTSRSTPELFFRNKAQGIRNPVAQTYQPFDY